MRSLFSNLNNKWWGNRSVVSLCHIPLWQSFWISQTEWVKVKGGDRHVSPGTRKMYSTPLILSDKRKAFMFCFFFQKGEKHHIVTGKFVLEAKKCTCRWRTPATSTSSFQILDLSFFLAVCTSQVTTEFNNSFLLWRNLHSPQRF